MFEQINGSSKLRAKVGSRTDIDPKTGIFLGPNYDVIFNLEKKNDKELVFSEALDLVTVCFSEFVKKHGNMPSMFLFEAVWFEETNTKHPLFIRNIICIAHSYNLQEKLSALKCALVPPTQLRSE